MIMPITIIIAMNLEPFLVNAILAGFAVALITGVMGCFVVWRRMAYFGDSLAHSALLGVALGFAVGIAVNIGIILICSVFALLLLWLQQKKVLATDTLLGILAHSALSWDGDDKRNGTTYRSAFNSFWRYSHSYKARVMVDLYWRYYSHNNAPDELVIFGAYDTSGRFGAG